MSRFCKKYFKDKKALENHKTLAHTNEHVCDVCDRHFASRQGLCDHYTRHTDSFLCPWCIAEGKNVHKYANYHGRKRHVKIYHTNEYKEATYEQDLATQQAAVNITEEPQCNLDSDSEEEEANQNAPDKPTKDAPEKPTDDKDEEKDAALWKPEHKKLQIYKPNMITVSIDYTMYKRC